MTLARWVLGKQVNSYPKNCSGQSLLEAAKKVGPPAVLGLASGELQGRTCPTTCVLLDSYGESHAHPYKSNEVASFTREREVRESTWESWSAV